MGRRTVVAVLVVFAGVLAACSADRKPVPPAPTGPVTSAPDVTSPATSTEPVQVSSVESSYGWATVPIGAGGFVTGLVATTGSAGELRLSARTDVGGAYRWDPDAGEWIQLLTAEALDAVGPESGDASVASLAVAPSDADRMYAAVGADFDPAAGEDLAVAGRVLRSDDGGSTWTTSGQRWFVSGNQEYRTGTERLAVDPADPDHVVFGTQRDGLWQSHDGGNTWTQISVSDVPAGLTADGLGQQAGVSMVAFVPTSDGSVLLVGVANHGVLASVDGGATWQMVEPLGDGDVPNGPEISGSGAIVAVIRVDGGSGRLFRVDAATLTTAAIDTPGDAGRWTLAVDPTDANHMVLTDDAVRDDHLWTSRDGGASWTAHDIELESPEIPWMERADIDQYMTAGRFVFDPTVAGRVWFADGMGVWRTDDLDADTVVWTSASVGMEITVVSGITARPSGDVIVTVADRQGFVVDPAGGYPDETLVDSQFASGSSLDVSADDPAVMAWVGAESNIADSPDRQVRGAVSVDGGASWQEMTGTRPDMYGGEVAVSATDPQVIAWLPSNPTDPAATEPGAGIYVSGDSGRSWQWHELKAEANSFHRLFWWFTRRALAADAVNGDLYLLSDAGQFFVGSDGGTTWTEAANAPPCSVDSDCHVYGQLQAAPDAAGALWASVGTAGLYRTADAGASAWERVPGVDEARAFAFGAPIGAGGTRALYLYGRIAGDGALGLWRTGDAGESWELVSRFPGDLPTTVMVLEADPDVPGRVYVGFNGSGVVVGDDR